MGIAYNTSVVKDGLVLYLDAANPKSYPGSGTVWKDLTIGNDGTLVNTPTYIEANRSIRFDVSDGVTLPDSLGYTTEVSAFAWFKSLGTPTGGYHIILGPQELEISVPTVGELRTGIVTTPTTRYVSNHGSGLTDGNWHYIGFTFAGTTKTSYIDGAAVGTLTTAGDLNATFPNRTIGRFGLSTQYFLNGEVSQVAVYNRALLATEIKQNYEALRGRYSI